MGEGINVTVSEKHVIQELLMGTLKNFTMGRSKLDTGDLLEIPCCQDQNQHFEWYIDVKALPEHEHTVLCHVLMSLCTVYANN